MGTVSVLGRCTVTPGPELSAIQRRIVAVLAALGPAGVSVNDLIDGVWGAAPPATAKAALHNQVSRMRQLCGASLILTNGGSYSLGWPVDLDQSIEALDLAERCLVRGEAEAAAERAGAIILGFHGEPFEELDDVHQFAVARRKARSIRRSAEVIRLRASIDAGRLGWAAVEAERLVGQYALDEQCWALLAEVHERSGRRGDALGVIDQARRTLRDALGVDPGHHLNAVHKSILGGARTRPRRADTTIVGRDDVLAELEQALHEHSLVIVRCEHGAGRSTVLRELARRVRQQGHRVGFTCCVVNPAAPLADLSEICDDLGAPIDPTLGLLNGFVNAVAAIASAATDEASVVLIVDDLHLAGPSTIAALRGASASPQVTVVAATDVESGWICQSDDRTIELRPLSAAAVTAFASAFTGRPVTEFAGAQLARASGGNPTFLEQLLDDASETGTESLDLVRDGDDGSALAELVRSRVDRIGPHGRAAIEIAAVCGPTTTTRLLDALVTHREGLTAAHTAGLLDLVGGTTEFRHTVVQRVVYNDLSPGRRVELHHSIGLALAAGNAPPGLVAHHLLAASPLDATLAIDAARRAAALATTQGAHLEAAEWLERAEGCWRAVGAADETLLIELLISRGDALRLAGVREHEELLFRAADLAVERGDPDLVADATFALLQLGSTSETGRIEARVAELADMAMRSTTDPERRAKVSAAASLTYSMSGHPDRCRALFVEGERIATTSAARRLVLPFAYLALGHPKDAAMRARLAAELLDLAQQADDATALFEAFQLLFSHALQTADGTGVRVALADMEQIVDRVGDVGRRWSLLYCSAALAHLEDRLDDSERLSEAALRVFSPVSPSRAFATYGAQLIVIRLAQHRIAELAAVFESLVVDQPGVPAWHAALALSIAEADPQRADEHARRALEDVPEDFTWLAGHVIGARAAAIAANPNTMARYRERLMPWSGTLCWQGTCTYGPVDTPLAFLASALGDHAAASHHRETAVRLARRLGGPVFEREIAAV